MKGDGQLTKMLVWENGSVSKLPLKEYLSDVSLVWISLEKEKSTELE